MKLRELIQNVDRSAKNEDDADIDAFCQALDINEWLGRNKEFDERVKGYALTQWLCTDTHVGMNVYYMDDRPVAVSSQSARKSDVQISFVSIEAAQQVKDFILTLVGADEFNPTLCDLEEECGEDYTVNYHSELLTDVGLYEGQEVKVIRRKMDYNNEPVEDWYKVDVILPDGSQERIHLDYFKIPYHLSKEEVK